MPDYHISITRATDSPIDESVLRSAIESALAGPRVPSAEINLAIVDDAHMAELNEEHLQHQGPTDVLTFDLRDAADSAHIEGQIVISLDTARREAAERGHSLEAELALYAIHGTLHLLGYDDHDEAEAAAMHKLEDELLTSLGLGPAFARGQKSNGQG